MNDTIRTQIILDPRDTVFNVTMPLCVPCLNGEGGECHTPGCAMWLRNAPDVPLLSSHEGALLVKVHGRPRLAEVEGECNACLPDPSEGEPCDVCNGSRWARVPGTERVGQHEFPDPASLIQDQLEMAQNSFELRLAEKDEDIAKLGRLCDHGVILIADLTKRIDYLTQCIRELEGVKQFATWQTVDGDPIEPGAIVYLTSGGPPMCVVLLRDGNALCRWWSDERGETVGLDFALTSLRRVPWVLSNGRPVHIVEDGHCSPVERE